MTEKEREGESGGKRYRTIGISSERSTREQTHTRRRKEGRSRLMMKVGSSRARKKRVQEAKAFVFLLS